MKAVVASILFIFCLLAVNSHANAAAGNGKLSFSATHNAVHKHFPEAKNFIDVEDEDDDRNIAKKITHHPKWISTIFCTVFSLETPGLPAANLTESCLLNVTGAEICIEHRVLRI